MELLNRDEYEQDMLTAFLGLSRKQKRRLRMLLGEPPDPANVPSEFWDEVRREQERELFAWLLYAFLKSAEQHGSPFGLSRQQTDIAGRLWVTTQLGTVLSGSTAYSVRLASRINQSNRETVLDQIFGQLRGEKMVITQLTEAAAQGGEFAAAKTGNLSADDIWFTRPEMSKTGVCPYCRPLHGQPRRRWLEIYQNIILPLNPAYRAYGAPRKPPAHPVCKCFISYAFESSLTEVAA